MQKFVPPVYIHSIGLHIFWQSLGGSARRQIVLIRIVAHSIPHLEN